MKVFLLSLVVLCCLLVGGCNSPAASTALGTSENGTTGGAAERVVLMLNWYPEAEHGGFYAAKVHGIYEKYGLDVELRAGGPNAPVAQELLTGRVQFAIGNADDVLLFREQEAPIVALMAPIQNTPRCVLVRADAPAKNLRELRGMTLQANVGRGFLTFMESEGMLDGVKVVPFTGSVAQLVTDPNTAVQAYSFSEPLLATQQGVEVRTMMLSDVGYNPYASCLMTTEAMIAERKDLVKRMVAASREGWTKYFETPEETNAAILKVNEHGMTAESLEFGVNVLRPLCIPTGAAPADMGAMSAARWSELVDQFVKIKLVSPANVIASEAFTTEFLVP